MGGKHEPRYVEYKYITFWCFLASLSVQQGPGLQLHYNVCHNTECDQLHARRHLQILESCNDKLLTLEKLWFCSCSPHFLPWCIGCCNEDIDHHSVTHVKAMLHCPRERETKQVTVAHFGKIFASSHFPDMLWNYFGENTITSISLKTMWRNWDTEELSTPPVLSPSPPHLASLSHQLCLIQTLLLFRDYWLNPIYGPESFRGLTRKIK